MKYTVCALLDRKAAVFGQPMFSNSLGGQVRALGDEVNRQAPENMLYRHSEDFDLYQLGTYDDEVAHFELLAQPALVVTASSLRKE